MLIPSGAIAPYQTDAVAFDGSNDYGTRGGDLTSNADGKKGIVSFWFKLTGGDAALQRFYDQTGSFNNVSRLTTNKMQIIGSNAAGTAILNLRSTTSYVADSTWHHLAASWDMATTGARWLYIDGADDLNLQAFTDDTIDYTRAEHRIGANVSAAGEKLNAEIADFYYNVSENLDLSDAGNLAKFIENGLPVDLGDDGSLPTGNQPIIFLRRPIGATADSFLSDNKGYGGDFTVTGALADATSPTGD